MKNNFEELVETYMKADKKTLAEMLALIELNKNNEEQIPYYPYSYPPSLCPPYNWPYVGDFPPYIPLRWYVTSDTTAYS